jgi:hypothetical protein
LARKPAIILAILLRVGLITSSVVFVLRMMVDAQNVGGSQPA